jgi:hypothetical protein
LNLRKQGIKLPDLSKVRPMTQAEEIVFLRKTVKELQAKVDSLSSVKDQHEEALNYLFEQVKMLRNKTK